MISQKVMVILSVVYVILGILSFLEGHRGASLYWVGAAILTTGVLLMTRGI